jgi:hypothetical protein
LTSPAPACSAHQIAHNVSMFATSSSPQHVQSAQAGVCSMFLNKYPEVCSSDPAPCSPHPNAPPPQAPDIKLPQSARPSIPSDTSPPPPALPACPPAALHACCCPMPLQAMLPSRMALKLCRGRLPAMLLDPYADPLRTRSLACLPAPHPACLLLPHSLTCP